MSAVVSGLVGAAIAAILAALAERKLKLAGTDAEGWRTLRASWLLNATFVASTAFAMFMGYYVLNGGSSRADAETQNVYALLLALAFGLAAIYLGWTTYGRQVMWKGNDLRVRTSFGRYSIHPISEISSVTRNEMLGEYRFKFRDGRTVRVSAYMHGVKDLVSRLPERSCEGL